MDEFIPVNTPLITDADTKAVSKCLSDNWISSDGPVVIEFEEHFSEIVQRRFGIAVTNGTTALEIALRALGLTKDDEVIVPDFMIISCALAVINAGARPVFADVDKVTWNICPKKVRELVTPKTRAILVAHVYHFPAEMDELQQIADEFGLTIIEDAAEMHGQNYKGRPCGSFGRISTFSFYANKNITTGEGGMIVTDDEFLAERCKFLRNLAFDNSRRFEHAELSSNYRMTSMQAALGLSQLSRLDEIIKKKRHIGMHYTDLLEGIPGLLLPRHRLDDLENIYWVYGILLDDDINLVAEDVMRAMNNEKIGTRPFFFPLHLQPAIRNPGAQEGNTIKVSKMLRRRGFYIPSGLGITELQQVTVAKKLKRVMSSLLK